MNMMWNLLNLADLDELDKMRMEESDSAKKALCTKPGGNVDGRRRRPKLRWCDEWGKGAARVGCRNRRFNGQSREEWRELTEEVKCHPGMLYQTEEEEREDEEEEEEEEEKQEQEQETRVIKRTNFYVMECIAMYEL